MTHEVLAALVLSWLTTEVPPDVAAAQSTYPEAAETADERRERYAWIADDVASVVTEQVEGAGKRRRYAALLTSIAIRESSLARDVDVGPCAPMRLKKGGCDGGRARGLWQLHGLDGWPSRREMATEALRRVSASLRSCRALPLEERLSQFCVGRCGPGSRSADRVELARRLLTR